MSARSPRLWWAVGALLGLLIVLDVALMVHAADQAASRAAATTGVATDRPLRRLALVDDHGRRTSLEAFRGRYVVLAPMLTTCREVCPLTMGALAAIRAGVDDRAMVSALGVNIQLTFAIAFAIGSALAGLGGVIGGSFASLAPGVDANWLLYSLVVVIIGGMGSLGGAAVGALLLGLVTNFSAAYLPADYTFYSIIFTFVLVAIVLAVRPLGLFGRPA